MDIIEQLFAVLTIQSMEWVRGRDGTSGGVCD